MRAGRPHNSRRAGGVMALASTFASRWDFCYVDVLLCGVQMQKGFCPEYIVNRYIELRYALVTRDAISYCRQDA